MNPTAIKNLLECDANTRPPVSMKALRVVLAIPVEKVREVDVDVTELALSVIVASRKFGLRRLIAREAPEIEPRRVDALEQFAVIMVSAHVHWIQMRDTRRIITDLMGEAFALMDEFKDEVRRMAATGLIDRGVLRRCNVPSRGKCLAANLHSVASSLLGAKFWHGPGEMDISLIHRAFDVSQTLKAHLRAWDRMAGNAHLLGCIRNAAFTILANEYQAMRRLIKHLPLGGLDADEILPPLYPTKGEDPAKEAA
jgi:hypothetical protein